MLTILASRLIHAVVPHTKSHVVGTNLTSLVNSTYKDFSFSEAEIVDRVDGLYSAISAFFYILL